MGLECSEMAMDRLMEDEPQQNISVNELLTLNGSIIDAEEIKRQQRMYQSGAISGRDGLRLGWMDVRLYEQKQHGIIEINL